MIRVEKTNCDNAYKVRGTVLHEIAGVQTTILDSGEIITRTGYDSRYAIVTSPESAAYPYKEGTPVEVQLSAVQYKSGYQRGFVIVKQSIEDSFGNSHDEFAVRTASGGIVTGVVRARLRPLSAFAQNALVDAAVCSWRSGVLNELSANGVYKVTPQSMQQQNFHIGELRKKIPRFSLLEGITLNNLASTVVEVCDQTNTYTVVVMETKAVHYKVPMSSIATGGRRVLEDTKMSESRRRNLNVAVTSLFVGDHVDVTRADGSVVRGEIKHVQADGLFTVKVGDVEVLPNISKVSFVPQFAAGEVIGCRMCSTHTGKVVKINRDGQYVVEFSDGSRRVVPYGQLNSIPSRLRLYDGVSVMVNGERQTGFSILKVDSDADTYTCYNPASKKIYENVGKSSIRLESAFIL